jgi:hypothetical protein
MVSDLVDRLGGVRSSLAFKAPCRVATTANITLSGLQTIDGVTLAEDDENLRVLVKNQNNTVENGIYTASATAWVRCKDFDGNDDAVTGTRVYVPYGATQAGEYYLTTADPVIIDTSAIVWSISGTGTGNVFGPASATLNAHPRFADTTGKVVKDGLVVEDDSGNVTGMATLTLPNTGLHLLDSNASHDLIIKPGSNLAADRTLTVSTGDTDIAIDLTDPGADRLLFWDDSAATWRDLTLGTNLSITTTTINAAGLPAETQAEAEAATSLTVGVVPGRQHFHPGHPKAGCAFNGTGTPALVSGDYGMASITDNAEGNYTLNFDTAFSNTNYWCAAIGAEGANPAVIVNGTKFTTGVQILTRRSTTAAVLDYDGNGVTVWGDHA